MVSHGYKLMFKSGLSPWTQLVLMHMHRTRTKHTCAHTVHVHIHLQNLANSPDLPLFYASILYIPYLLLDIGILDIPYQYFRSNCPIL